MNEWDVGIPKLPNVYPKSYECQRKQITCNKSAYVV